MTNKSLVKYENEYDKALVVNGSALGLLDQLIELDGQKPYLEISSDEDIQNYFNKKGINVTNKKELENFYNYLENKVAELSESSDERVRLYFEKREYLKQLEALPSNLSKLEQTISSGFEELKVPFRAVMNYVWDAVINNGFGMEEEGKDALEKYEGKIRMKKYAKSSEIKITYQKYEFDFNIHKEEIEEKMISETKRKFLWFKETKYKEIEKIKKAKEGDFFVFARCVRDGGDYCNYAFSVDSIEESIDKFGKDFIKASEERQKESGYFIKTILNLPKIMDNYVKRKQENLTKMFSEINGK